MFFKSSSDWLISVFLLIGCSWLSGRSLVLRASLARRRPKQTHQIPKPARDLQTRGRVTDSVPLDQSQPPQSDHHLARSLVAEQSGDGLERLLIGSFALTRRQNDSISFSEKATTGLDSFPQRRRRELQRRFTWSTG